MKFATVFISITLLTSSAVAEGPSFSVGPATVVAPGLLNCSNGSRVRAIGAIKSKDGKLWIVPAETHFKTATKAADLYNECNDATDTMSLKGKGGRNTFRT